MVNTGINVGAVPSPTILQQHQTADGEAVATRSNVALLDGIPAALLKERRWVGARVEERDGRVQKVPYNPNDSTREASVIDPTTWADYESVRRLVEDGTFPLAGFALGDGLVGIDLDDCRNPDTGEIESWASDIISELDSYTEASVSGTGVHIICRGALPEGGRRKGAVEMYDRARYFVATGHVLADAPRGLDDRTSQLAVLHRRVFGSSKDPESIEPASSEAVTPTASGLSDDEVLRRARSAANAGKFERLWSGDSSGYSSSSEADLALCSILAFYTRDDVQIDRLLRASGLSRDKLARDDYRKRTIAAALASQLATTTTPTTAGAGAVSRRYIFRDRDELLRSTATPFLVQGILTENSLVVLVSPPGCNKTFLALDLALSIASGQQKWLNRPLHRSGPVVYVLGEGEGRFKLRVQAWDQVHQIPSTQPYPFHFVKEPVALTNPTDATAFVREVASLKPVLVVFDTLSRCLAGADENNQRDMSAAVSVCDELRRELGCTVLLLHHTTKDGTAERGSSVLRGAVDTMLILKVGDPSQPPFSMVCEKQKDAEPFADIALVREQVTLESERDPYTGDRVFSCVVKVAAGAQADRQANSRLRKAQRYMLRNPECTRTELAVHLGGRRKESLREIAEWEFQGVLTFTTKRQRDPLAALKNEQATEEPEDAPIH